MYAITMNFNTLDEMQELLARLLPQGQVQSALALLQDMRLEDLLLYTDERCQAEGYEMNVRKAENEPEAAPRSEDPVPVAVPEDLEQSLKKSSAKLKKDLKASIETLEKKSNGHAKPETDDERKKRCVDKLQEWFYAGHKDEVRKLLKQYGDGAKSFQAVAVERFAEIDQAMGEVKL